MKVKEFAESIFAILIIVLTGLLFIFFLHLCSNPQTPLLNCILLLTATFEWTGNSIPLTNHFSPINQTAIDNFKTKLTTVRMLHKRNNTEGEEVEEQEWKDALDELFMTFNGSEPDTYFPIPG